MNTEIDARNISCPQPVIFTKKALDQMEQGTIITIVNDDVAKENVLTLAQNMGCDVEIKQSGDEYFIHITKKSVELDCREMPLKNEVIVFSSYGLGRGSDELGEILSKAFFYTLVESEELPSSMIFLNSGVKLACEGSPVIEHLINLEKRGMEILACGTCLDYYRIKDRLCVGQVSNMYTIWDKINKADKSINF